MTESKKKKKEQPAQEESQGKRFQESIDDLFGLVPEPAPEKEDGKEDA